MEKLSLLSINKASYIIYKTQERWNTLREESGKIVVQVKKTEETNNAAKEYMQGLYKEKKIQINDLTAFLKLQEDLKKAIYEHKNDRSGCYYRG